MKILEPKTQTVDLSALQNQITTLQADLAKAKTDLQTSIDRNAAIADGIGAPIAGINRSLGLLNTKVLELDARPTGGLTIVDTDYELISWSNLTQFQQIASRESKLLYQFYPSTVWLVGTPGTISHDQGVWIPTNYAADSRWIQPSEMIDNCYQRNFVGTTVTSLSFEIASQDKTQRGTFSLSDFATGFTQNGYWGIPVKFTNVTAGNKTLSVTVGFHQVANNRIILNVQDPSLPYGSRQCWIRNVRVNNLPADYAEIGKILAGI